MAATITREQLNKLLEGIATSHWQVHTYGWGDVPDLLAREDVIYPFMMVTPQASVYGDNTINHTYTISIADRVLKDKENEVAVDSDTHQILMDVVTQLDNLLYDDVDLIKGITVTPFFDNFRHEVTGHFANVTVQVMYNYDACAIPSDNVVLPLPPPEVCLPASYRVQYEDGTLIEEGTIPSGGSVTVDVPNIVPCADATWELRDSAGVLIDSGSIASGGSETITAPDGVVTITDSDNATLYVVNVQSNGTATQEIGDSTAVLKDTAGVTLSTTNIKAEASEDITAPDGDITVNSVAFSTVESGGTGNVEVRKSSGMDLVGSKQGTSWRIGDSTVNVNKSDGALISARTVKAEETENFNVADSVITNDATSPTYTENVKATENLVLPAQQINVNSVNEGDINSVGVIDINVTDGVDPVTPDAVSVSGRTVTIEVPTGGVSMDVDFSADKLTAAPFEDITFTDLSDESPTHWSWRFGDSTSSQVQNPIKQYTAAGIYDVTLLAGRVGAGGVAIKNAYIEIIVSFFTNLFGVPKIAYSLRKLSPDSVYSGAAIRVRRSSDNAEQDINFVSSAANSGIDTAALLSFVGSGDGFIATWYDQSGNGFHISNTSGAAQPKIVDSGVVILKSSLPTTDFDGSNDELLNSSTSIFTGSETFYSTFMVAATKVNNNDGILFNIGKGTNGYAAGFGGVGTSHAIGTRLRSGASLVGRSEALSNNNLFIHSGLANVTGAANSGFLNGASMTGVLQARSSGAPDKGDVVLGNINVLASSFFLNGNISELVLYPSDKSADRTAIETNINNYYNVF